MFKDEADIHIYEGSKIGGRLATAGMSDKNEYETGGSIIHERNRYMSDFVKELGKLRLRYYLACGHLMHLFSKVLNSVPFHQTPGSDCTMEKISISLKVTTIWSM